MVNSSEKDLITRIKYYPEAQAAILELMRRLEIDYQRQLIGENPSEVLRLQEKAHKSKAASAIREYLETALS